MACDAVSSVLETLEQLLYSPNMIQREHIESLQKKFTFFEKFLLQSSAEFNNRDEFVRNMKRVIRYLAFRVEDYIAEILFSRSIQAGELENRHQIIDTLDRAKGMFQEIDFFEKEVIRFCGIQLLEENCSAEGLSLQSLNLDNSVDHTFLAILDRVTGLPSKLQILGIVGTRSMGKTNLAKRIFDNPFVSHHFNIRARITVSERSSAVRNILLDLLKSIGCISGGIYEKNDSQLCELLFRGLRGQRYLIVLDNIWCTKIWNAVKRSFPDDKNGSRVLLTSRIMNLGIHVLINRSSHGMHFPSGEEVWKKHFQELFISEDFNPLELVKIGEQIVKEHQGLFLGIVLAAGTLAKISDTPNYWGDFMQNAGSVTSESLKGIFSLSFNQLPHYLRACFSFVGILPDDCEIFIYIIIRVWDFFGVLKPERLKRLEDVAKVHFEDLVENSLNNKKIIRWSDCRVKRNFVPDLLWHLNSTSARKKKFLDLMTKFFKFVSMFMDDDCPFSFQSEIDFCIWLRPVAPLTRSFQCFGVEEWFQPKKWSNIKGDFRDNL